MLERATRAYANEPAVKDDFNYLMLWLSYVGCARPHVGWVSDVVLDVREDTPPHCFPPPARRRPPQADAVPDPGDIFAFVVRRRIGSGWALLYLAWAYDAERRGDWALAEAVYERGAAVGAAPAERLAARRHEFRRRAYSKWLAALRAREAGASYAGQAAGRGRGIARREDCPSPADNAATLGPTPQTQAAPAH